MSSVAISSSVAFAARSSAVINNNEISDEEVSFINKLIRAHRLLERYRDITDISIFLQIDFAINFFLINFSSIFNFNFISFMKSRQKKLNELLEKDVFEVVFIHFISKDTRIFNSRFVNEIKNIETTNVYEKSRLVVQIYNDREKATILIQASTIQRMSQRLILALTVSLSHLDLYLRDITQIYVQSTTFFSRQFYVRSSIEIELSNESILKVLKSLYDVSKADVH